MPAKRILRVVVGDRCSLCDVALDRLRAPADLLGVGIVTEALDEHDHRERYATRVPVLLDVAGRVLAEGRISSSAAWMAALRVRMGRDAQRDSGA